MKKKLLLTVSLLTIVVLLITGCATATTTTVTTTKTSTVTKTVSTEGPAASNLITVYNPLGQPPDITLAPMAPRLDTLVGKTIYIVNIRYPYTDQLFVALAAALSAAYPDTTWVFRDKAGAYGTDDPELWAEIAEKGDGMVMGIGH